MDKSEVILDLSQRLEAARTRIKEMSRVVDQERHLRHVAEGQVRMLVQDKDYGGCLDHDQWPAD